MPGTGIHSYASVMRVPCLDKRRSKKQAQLILDRSISPVWRTVLAVSPIQFITFVFFTMKINFYDDTSSEPNFLGFRGTREGQME